MVFALLLIPSIKWIGEHSGAFQHCAKEAKENQAYSALHQSHSVFIGAGIRTEITLACTGAWTDANHDSVNTLATVCIAFFTLTLWWSTRRLWQSAEAQRKADGLARRADITRLEDSLRVATEHAEATKAIVASHENKTRSELRAYVNVKKVCLEDDGRRTTVAIILKNYGKTPAYDANALVKAAIRPFPFDHMKGPWVGEDWIAVSRFPIPPGGTVKVRMEENLPHLFGLDLLPEGTLAVWAIGRVRYSDVFSPVPHNTRIRFFCTGKDGATGTFTADAHGNECD